MRRIFDYSLIVSCLIIAGLGVLNIQTANRSIQYCNEACEQVKLTFFDQCEVNETQREIAIAQDYANNLAAVLRVETDRVQQLESRLQEASDAFFVANEQTRLANLRIEMLVGYINQLREHMVNNDLPVPAPDPNSFSQPTLKEQAQEALRDD